MAKHFDRLKKLYEELDIIDDSINAKNLSWQDKLKEFLKAIGGLAKHSPEKFAVIDDIAKELDIEFLIPEAFKLLDIARKPLNISGTQIQTLLDIPPLDLLRVAARSNVFKTSDFAPLSSLVMKALEDSDSKSVSPPATGPETTYPTIVNVEDILQIVDGVDDQINQTINEIPPEELKQLLFDQCQIEIEDEVLAFYLTLLPKLSAISKCFRHDERFKEPLQELINAAGFTQCDINTLARLPEMIKTLNPIFENPQLLNDVLTKHQAQLEDFMNFVNTQCDEEAPSQQNPFKAYLDFIFSTAENDPYQLINDIAKELKIEPLKPDALNLLKIVHKARKIPEKQIQNLTNAMNFLPEVVLASDILTTSDLFSIYELYSKFTASNKDEDPDIRKEVVDDLLPLDV